MSGGAPVLVVNPVGPFVPIPGVPINPLTIPPVPLHYRGLGLNLDRILLYISMVS